MSCNLKLCQLSNGCTGNWFRHRLNPDGHSFDKAFSNDGEINAINFVLAAGEFVTILDTQENIAFRPVRERFMNNVEQMSTYVARYSTEFRTLGEMVHHEQTKNPPRDMDVSSASRGVLWFTRAVQFLIETFFNNLSKPDEELKVSFVKAYAKTLSRHHDPFVKPLFSAAMLVCPSRYSFYACLAAHDTIGVACEDAKTYFMHMQRALDYLVPLCQYYGWDVSTN